jgi:hypothetical protein
MEKIICDKIGYRTYKELMSAINGVAKRTKTKFKSYKCNECGLYHITSIKSGKLQKPLKERKYPLGMEKKEVVMKFKDPTPLDRKITHNPAQITTGRFMTTEQAQALKRIVQVNQGK